VRHDGGMIDVSIHDRVALLRINRPEKLNALTTRDHRPFATLKRHTCRCVAAGRSTAWGSSLVHSCHATKSHRRFTVTVVSPDGSPAPSR
jgi:hypothetical protein